MKYGNTCLQELYDLFKSIDCDGSGSLTLPEVVLFLKSITDDLSEENIEKIFDGLDETGDKSIDFEEFKVSLYCVLMLFVISLFCILLSFFQ